MILSPPCAQKQQASKSTIRRKVRRPDLKGLPVDLMATSICDCLDFFGGRMTLRRLRLALNYRRHEAFQPALAKLQAMGAIRIEKVRMDGRLRASNVIELVETPKLYQATTPIAKKRKNRTGGQTPWFKELMRRRAEEEARAESVSNLPDSEFDNVASDDERDGCDPFESYYTYLEQSEQG